MWLPKCVAQVGALVGRLRGEVQSNLGKEQVFGGGDGGEGPVGSGADGGDGASPRGGRCFQPAQSGVDFGGGRSYLESFGRCGRNGQFSGDSNGGRALSSCRENCGSFGHTVESRSDTERHKNVDADVSAVCEGGKNAVEAEIRREELGRGEADLDSNTEKEEMLMHMGDGGSDDTADTGDGATDHEDLHMEDDSSSLPSHPHDEENDKSSNASGTTSGTGSTTSSATSSSDPNSDTEANGNRTAPNDGHGNGDGSALTGGIAARMLPRGKIHGGKGVPPFALRRRGWSSSKLAFPGPNAGFKERRRASGDLAVRAIFFVVACRPSSQAVYTASNPIKTAVASNSMLVTPVRDDSRGHRLYPSPWQYESVCHPRVPALIFQRSRRAACPRHFPCAKPGAVVTAIHIHVRAHHRGGEQIVYHLNLATKSQIETPLGAVYDCRQDGKKNHSYMRRRMHPIPRYEALLPADMIHPSWHVSTQVTGWWCVRLAFAVAPEARPEGTACPDLLL